MRKYQKIPSSSLYVGHDEGLKIHKTLSSFFNLAKKYVPLTLMRKTHKWRPLRVKNFLYIFSLFFHIFFHAFHIFLHISHVFFHIFHIFLHHIFHIFKIYEGMLSYTRAGGLGKIPSLPTGGGIAESGLFIHASSYLPHTLSYYPHIYSYILLFPSYFPRI